MKYRVVVAGLGLLAAANVSTFALTEDFSTDPFATWSFGVGGTEPSTNRFVWNTGSAPVYTGDATGSLNVHLDSSLPTVRFDRPLGVTVTDTNSFVLTTQFSFTITSAPTNQSMQIAFGLVNSAQTGGNRTGTAGVYTDDNTFHTVEFNYFPQISTWGDPPTGPNVSPAVVGAQHDGLDAFGNFASYFFGEADLSDNTGAVHELPQSVTLQASLTYNGTAKTLALALYQVNGDGSLTGLDIEQPAMSLTSLPAFGTYNTNFPFVADSLAIMAYNDGFTTAGDPSLVADLTFQRLDFQTIPEPSSAMLAALGLTTLMAVARRRR